jgi:hypothetical protein
VIQLCDQCRQEANESGDAVKYSGPGWSEKVVRVAGASCNKAAICTRRLRCLLRFDLARLPNAPRPKQYMTVPHTSTWETSSIKSTFIHERRVESTNAELTDDEEARRERALWN